MVKNHKLAQAISDSEALASLRASASWGQFLTLLEYKGNLYGCEIRRLDMFFPSSKRCSKCGYIHENLTLDIREWTCPEGGTHHDRDVNAAINILVFSDPQIRQELPKFTPKEPVERRAGARRRTPGSSSTHKAGIPRGLLLGLGVIHLKVLESVRFSGVL